MAEINPFDPPDPEANAAVHDVTGPSLDEDEFRRRWGRWPVPLDPARFQDRRMVAQPANANFLDPRAMASVPLGRPEASSFLDPQLLDPTGITYNRPIPPQSYITADAPVPPPDVTYSHLAKDLGAKDLDRLEAESIMRTVDRGKKRIYVGRKDR